MEVQTLSSCRLRPWAVPCFPLPTLGGAGYGEVAGGRGSDGRATSGRPHQLLESGEYRELPWKAARLGICESFPIFVGRRRNANRFWPEPCRRGRRYLAPGRQSAARGCDGDGAGSLGGRGRSRGESKETGRKRGEGWQELSPAQRWVLLRAVAGRPRLTLKFLWFSEVRAARLSLLFMGSASR